MPDTRIAQDYLTDLFAKLAAGDLDPTRVDWPFAAEAWRAVRGELEQLRGERDELKRLTDPYGAFEDADALIAYLNEPTPQEAALQTELERLQADRDKLLKAIKLHLAHHEHSCVYFDEALEDRTDV